jgi:hypothetical protein
MCGTNLKRSLRLLSYAYQQEENPALKSNSPHHSHNKDCKLPNEKDGAQPPNTSDQPSPRTNPSTNALNAAGRARFIP